MAQLNDTQRVLLANAAQRDDHSLLPLPDTLTAGARATKAIADLIGAAFAIERETNAAAAFHRNDGDIGYGVFATEIGLAAIGITGDASGDAGDEQPPAPPVAKLSKSAAVIALLARAEGATLAELIAATNWLPHTTRAALTSLRKKGHAIERSKRDDTTCYRIVVTG